MTDPENLMIFVQSLKGAPASVLLALGWARRPMSHQELQVWTRCGHRQVTFALQSLVAMGCVSARTLRGPWQLARGCQLPVLPVPLEGSALRALNDDDSLKDQDPFSAGKTLTTSAPGGQLLQALFAAGIREPTASELAALPHVTPEYVRLHTEQARQEGLKVGVAILRMRLAEPVPAEAAPRAEDAAEKIRRFMQGPA
jgi:hypothetical protein